MKKTKTVFTIVITLLTLTLTSQPAMSRNAENILTGAVLGAGFGQVIGHNTEATLIGATVGALIASQVGYYPTQQYVPRRPRFYSRPVLMVPVPAFRPRPVVYVPQPEHYRRHRYQKQHRHHRNHWKRHGKKARW